MKKQQLLPILGASLGMLALILDGQTALLGAAEGIDLCIRTIIPSLFPFFVLSALLTGSLLGQNIPFLRSLGRLCSIPEGAESLLAVGFLGGYPVGAQNIAQAYRNRQLSRRDAERMLMFCSNAGPAFLFGILGPLFSRFSTCWILWGIHIFSALFVGVLIPGVGEKRARVSPSPVTLTDALERSVKTVSLVCGWVVLFRILLTFLNRWIFWMLPRPLLITISGLLELSNGCVQLASIESEGLRFLIAGGLLAFGGCCVTLQTASVCRGLSLGLYFPGKMLQCAVSVLLCGLLQGILPENQRWETPPVFFLVTLSTVLILSFFLRRSEKTSSILAPVGV